MSKLRQLKERAALLNRELLTLHFAYRDPATGFLPKLVILITLGYALSPVDLIPDFIPVLGYLDDLIIIPALISISIKLIPADVMADARIKAEETELKLGRRWFFGIIFIILWIAVLLLLIIRYPGISHQQSGSI